jgi:hypothetical protein
MTETTRVPTRLITAPITQNMVREGGECLVEYESPEIIATYSEDELTEEAAVCCTYSSTPID